MTTNPDAIEAVRRLAEAIHFAESSLEMDEGTLRAITVAAVTDRIHRANNLIASNEFDPTLERALHMIVDGAEILHAWLQRSVMGGHPDA